ncbi:Vesicle-associated protein 1-1 [Capsicum chinense]|uniref:Vesicle-associated protein 1-1 n=1 Tax=Capsicum annuum TaxID=4072 RepID=A0A1U8GX77_CAPAN|nr:vesicle-associated protein 1-2 isoform X1 [Capsicum annuum]KAF3636582.1 Vesicle-associated protein 1-1 [Capsicum annuum]KAF3677193.1 Vesicle-associated protein 1-1 [Capsicum annuum]PHT78391.1 Vesicle-associated protein 1-1 [Capsicum annuum]PHU14147.1 Vesicle-associated protein 1-1 [Capsicum chinense]
MTSEELVSIDPLDLKFPLELNKSILSSFEVINKTDNHVAFKVKTTNPRKYTVRPNCGIVLPQSRSNITVTMQPQLELPPDMECKDKFLVQSVITNPGSTPKDINPDMFNKSGGNHVEECKLKVIYVFPPRKPSPVPEDSEEGTSPTASETDLQEHSEPQDNSIKARDLILKLMEERDFIIQQNAKLNRDLEHLRHGRQEHRTGVPLLYILLVGLLGILLGYIVRNV